MEASTRRGPEAKAKGHTGSGTGSSDNDSLASEVGRLSEENAHLSRRISEMLGKTSATPSSSRSLSGPLLSGNDRIRDTRRLEKENRRLTEANATLERQLSSSNMSSSAEDMWKLREQNRVLKGENMQLTSEIQQLNKVASYVGTRVAKVLVGARRANNYNSQLVGELKRWNRRLEDENHRLYNIIDRLQNSRSGSDAVNAANEASRLSHSHTRGREGNAALVKQLEDQNVKLQEEISKLSDHAISLQNLSSSSGSSGSSGPIAAPRTPSNHEDGPAPLRRTLTPEQDAGKAVVEKLRSVEAERAAARKMRSQSAESLGSVEASGDVERLRSENKKYAEEIERIGADLAFLRTQVTTTKDKELADSKAVQNERIEKLAQAAARVASLEESHATQRAEIERLLEDQTKLKQEAALARDLRDDNLQMEEDIFKLADEVERLQPMADKAAELERRIEVYQQELADIRAASTDTAAAELAARLKEENVEVQRTLAEMAAEKAVLQAQVRELLEERAQLQSTNKDLDRRARQLQEKANQATSLRAELAGMGQLKGQSAAYRAQISTLRQENELLARKSSNLAAQIAALKATQMASVGSMKGHSETAAQLAALTTEKAELEASHSNSEAELAALHVSHSNVAAELETLRAENARFSEAAAQLETLRAENAELQAKATASVLLTVEVTTLRNQVADLRKTEIAYEEQAAALKQLRAEKAALQKDAAALEQLSAEVAMLKAQVAKAEAAQHAAEAALAAAAGASSVAAGGLAREHAARGENITDLQKRQVELEEALQERDQELAALRNMHAALQRTQVAGVSGQDEATELRIALEQEKSRNASVASEAAELHALLDTAQTERTSRELIVDRLRADNADLVQKLSALAERNEEQEKTLAAVLARGQANGHDASAAHSYSNGTGNGNGNSSSRPVSPFTTVPGSASPAPITTPDKTEPAPKKTASGSFEDKPRNGAQPLKTAKSGSKGFGKFFSKLGKKSSSSLDGPKQADPPTPRSVAASVEPQEEVDERMQAQMAEEQVISMYDRYVDADDIDGFMAALGFSGFRGPTREEDMEAAFAAAKRACRPDAVAKSSTWDREIARATHSLLDMWASAAFGDDPER